MKNENKPTPKRHKISATHNHAMSLMEILLNYQISNCFVFMNAF